MKMTTKYDVKCDCCGEHNYLDKHGDLMYFQNSTNVAYECVHCHTFQLISMRKLRKTVNIDE